MARDYRLWTEPEITALREDLAAGLTAADTARRLKRSVRSVENKRRDEAPAVRETHILPLPGLEDLRPVQLTGPPPRRRSVTANAGVTVVAGDFHFPAQDDAAVGVFLETVRELRPSRVILNGDLPDMLAVSRFPKEARKRFNWTLRDEAVAMHGFLRELERVVSEDCEIVETEANHSGNGTGSRWWRYLSDRVPHIVQMDGAEDKLSYAAWWYPEWSRITLEDSVILADALLVTHGEMARKWAAYSARAHAEKYMHSVLHSHTHRMGSSMQRVPEIGRRCEAVVRSYEIGCMCRLEPGYSNAPNWTQGFAVVTEDGADYGVELVSITNGRAVVGALGKSVRAA